MKLPKSTCASDCLSLEQLPNIGPALADDLRLIGVRYPMQLQDRDAWDLYQNLCLRTAALHDPCVLDSFIAACAFMRGAQALPWWHYTQVRKNNYGPAMQDLRERLQAQHLDRPVPFAAPHARRRIVVTTSYAASAMGAP